MRAKNDGTQASYVIQTLYISVILTINSYYELGHLVPNGDYRSAIDKEATFVVFNRIPQVCKVDSVFIWTIQTLLLSLN
jgi:hypothetical protein